MTARNRRKKASHLRLVEAEEEIDLLHPLADPIARTEFEKLTQDLFDICIEMMDVVDGDPDLESRDEDLEESDGV